MQYRNRILINNHNRHGLKLLIYKHAINLNISGWVMNKDTEIIEIIAQADEQCLLEFYKTIKCIVDKEEDLICITRMETDTAGLGSFRIG